MKRTVIRFVPVDSYDIVGMERWLEEQAQKGLVLRRLGWLCGYFRRGEPEQVTYRVEPIFPANAGLAPNEETRELYRQSGWEYVTQLARTFWVFRAISPEPEEIHTDPMAQEYVYKRLSKEVRNLIFSRILFLLYPLFLGSMDALRMWDTPTYALVWYSGGLLFYLPLFLWGVFMVIQGLWRLRYLRRLQRSMASGILLTHGNVNTIANGIDNGIAIDNGAGAVSFPRGVRTLSLIGSALLVAAEIGVLSFFLFVAAGSPAEREEVLCYLPLSQVESGEFEKDSQLGEDSSGYGFSLLAPKQYTIEEYGRTTEQGQENEVFMRTEYFELVSPRLSARVVDEMIQSERVYFDDLQVKDYAHEGFDQLKIGGWADVQYLFGSRGNQVIEVVYSGSRDLSDLADELGEKLEAAT